MAESGLLAPVHLRSEYLENPIGIDETLPMLSWWVNDPRRGARQTAYQIRVGNAPGQADWWDSGQVPSDQSAQVPYAGRPLLSGQRAYWQVRTWDAQGQASPWSQIAFWEMGLLSGQDWTGSWIGLHEETHPVPGPATYLRCEFSVKAPVVAARLYITARGVYIPYVNGQRIGQDRLTPGWTDYHIRIRYQTYDLTPQIRPGVNALGAILSDGWYCGHMTWTDRKCLYGDRPWLLAQLHIDYADGSRQVVVSDGDWRATNQGPIVSTSFLHGDTLDSRKNLGDWSQAGFDQQTWQPVAVAPRDLLPLIAQAGPTVRKIDELPPQSWWKLPNGDWVFDLGQNMVGVVRLKMRGPCGQVITLHHGEMLTSEVDRSVYLANLRSAKATDTFILGGQDEESFEPPFTLHGFRYVQVSGLEEEPSPQMITGLVYHSATPPTGSFACAHPQLNQLQHNIVWGQKGNFVEVPTDCPQRDERLGWMGDAQAFLRTAAFNMDVAGFFGRWLLDVCDAQLPDGAFTDVAPDVLSGRKTGTANSGAPAWADAGIICPWTIYLCYGDRRILERCYPAMSRYVDYLLTKCANFLHPDAGYGDWLAIGSDTPKDLIGTAYSANSMDLMRRIATILGKSDDAARFAWAFAGFKAAFNREFVTSGGRVLGNCQTADVLALHFGLVDEPARSAVMTHLCRDIQLRGVLTTGFAGVNLLLPTLSQIGRDDLAYTLLTNEKFPSWLFSVNQGATTIWERWDGWTPQRGFQDASMNSFNHYAYGSCGQWMYAYIGGLDVDEGQPGYKRLVLRPTAGAGLTWAKVALDTVYGRAESNWSLQDGIMTLEVLIPANTTAAVLLPGELLSGDAGAVETNTDADGKTQLSLAAGRYTLKIRLAGL